MRQPQCGVGGEEMLAMRFLSRAYQAAKGGERAIEPV